MSGWNEGLADSLGVPPLEAEVERRLLEVAREVAHRVERRDAPLATYLMGVGVGERIGLGTPADAALTEVLEIVLGSLPAERRP
jgi:hypothetical protein